MPDIEKYIKDHLDEFGSNEPEPGHFRRFEDRLAKESAGMRPLHSRSTLMRIAALIVVLVTVSVFIFDFATRQFRESFAGDGNTSELPLEIREAEQYYDNITTTQIATLNHLAAHHDDAGRVSSAALKEIQGLDATIDELKESLTASPGNERIMDAIIRNQQMKETILNTIIARLSQANK